MKEKYYVNNDPTANPNNNHEVHTEKHANKMRIKDKTYVGTYDNCEPAVKEAKRYYSDADGCVTCCNSCHTG